MRRELPEFVKVKAREKLEEALEMYERGEPLWIYTRLGWVLDREQADMSITIKDAIW